MHFTDLPPSLQQDLALEGLLPPTPVIDWTDRDNPQWRVMYHLSRRDQIGWRRWFRLRPRTLRVELTGRVPDEFLVRFGLRP